MIHKFTILSSLVLSATCMVLHQPLPLLVGLQYDSNPHYNFDYEVNDGHTGDIKSQQESRRGDIVRGQYSLLQPDGVRRTVDYRADDHTGFQVTVNNDGRSNANAQSASNDDVTRHSNVAVQSYQAWPTPSTPQTYQANTPSAPQSYQAYPTSSAPQSYQAYPTSSAPQSYQAYPTSSAPQSYQAYPTSSAPQSYQAYPTSSAPQAYQAWPTPSASHPAPTPAPVAISRSSFTQTISHGTPVHQPWA